MNFQSELGPKQEAKSSVVKIHRNSIAVTLALNCSVSKPRPYIKLKGTMYLVFRYSSTWNCLYAYVKHDDPRCDQRYPL